MTSIRVQSPTRVDLAGGTLDLWPLYNFVGGASTINIAIDIKTEAHIDLIRGNEINWISDDLQLKKKYSDFKEALLDPDPWVRLFQVQLQYWKKFFVSVSGQQMNGVSVRTKSDSPVGGGLGGSSSLTISLLKAFSKAFDKSHFTDIHHLVRVAHNLEAQILNTPTGTQDYYPAAMGGLNILNYSSDGIFHQAHPVVGTDLEKHFLLMYTGKAHHSGLNNFEVLTQAVQKKTQTLEALFELKEISNRTIQACESQSFSELPSLFQLEFKARIKLAPAFSSPEIEKLHQLALQSGAEAVKICGAGGGGCVLIWVEPANRKRVIEACQNAGFKALPAKPVDLI